MHHSPPFVGIGQRTAHGSEVIRHMRGVGSTGDNRGHPWVTQQIFEKKLRPASGERGSPIRKCLTAHGAEQAAAAKRQRREHPGLVVPGER